MPVRPLPRPARLARLVARPVVSPVVCLVAGAALLTACGDGEAATGDRVVVGAGSAELTGDEIPVVIPTGQFVVTVGEPTDTVPADDADDGEAHTAPEGFHYVGLGWRPAGTAPVAGVVLGDSDPQPATVTVSGAERETAVTELAMDPADGPANGLAWVLLDADQPAELAVAYDGLTQTFDLESGDREPGPADGFYDLTATPVDCPADGPGRGAPGWQYSVECQVSPVTAVPYVAGRGWADQGRTWLTFDLSLSPSSFRWSAGGGPSEPAALYRVDAQAGAVTLDGTEAEVLAEGDLAGDAYTATYAVDAPAGEPAELEISRTYDLTRQKGEVAGAPEADTVDFGATVRTDP